MRIEKGESEESHRIKGVLTLVESAGIKALLHHSLKALKRLGSKWGETITKNCIRERRQKLLFCFSFSRLVLLQLLACFVFSFFIFVRAVEAPDWGRGKKSMKTINMYSVATCGRQSYVIFYGKIWIPQSADIGAFPLAISRSSTFRLRL